MLLIHKHYTTSVSRSPPRVQVDQAVGQTSHKLLVMVAGSQNEVSVYRQHT